VFWRAGWQGGSRLSLPDSTTAIHVYVCGVGKQFIQAKKAETPACGVSAEIG
jgi:hypothetical protein